MIKEKRNHSANIELATALFKREDHYFFKPTQQKANITPLLSRNSAATVPNGIVSQYTVFSP